MSELAQVNLARLRALLDDPSMRGFVDALDGIHRLAEAGLGFVWRLGTGADHGLVVVTVDGGPAFLNLSLWEDYAARHGFVYRSGHGGFVRNRSRWFTTTRQPSTALWWVPAGTRPTAGDAARRLQHLRTHRPSPRALTAAGVPN
ncbi:DUF3291 domain-containing protein [Pseudonocardia petroleophila]|uniref:DUF3291 domain-containing protein n=1 Tax=Pseudonocardia petroleophila TaxID=37331 RepID=A0A7G7MFG7_9PSEU|nr:DUF3291 domain-containing protein [Pseudonocardia petroleophila]QNG51528.1 DUF3291 domain-containing protein [Pseudonocardia petroleophila]